MMHQAFPVYSVSLREETQHIIKPTGHRNDCDRRGIMRKQNGTGYSTNGENWRNKKEVISHFPLHIFSHLNHFLPIFGLPMTEL